jgi:hypothetical protein
MELTIQFHDVVIGSLAVIGTVLLFAAGLAVLVRVLGRRIPDIEETAAEWLLRDADSWRARHERQVYNARRRARLEPVSVEAAD